MGNCRWFEYLTFRINDILPFDIYDWKKLHSNLHLARVPVVAYAK